MWFSDFSGDRADSPFDTLIHVANATACWNCLDLQALIIPEFF